MLPALSSAFGAGAAPRARAAPASSSSLASASPSLRRPPSLLLAPARRMPSSALAADASSSSSASNVTTTTTKQQQPQRPKSRQGGAGGRASPAPGGGNSNGNGGNDPRTREQQLWDRQAALMEREQRRWDQERATWRAREAALLAELAETRKALVALALAAATGARPGAVAAVGGGGSSSSSSNAAAPAAAPAASSTAGTPAWAGLFDQAQDEEPTVMSPNAAASAAAAAALAAAQEAAAAALAAAAEAEAEADARVSSSVAAAMGAAMAAAKDMDVLSLDTDAFLASAVGSNSKASGAAPVAAPVVAPAPAAPVAPAAAAKPPSPPPVEVPRGDPQGPPPVLSAGDDDIYWMDRLHAALASQGYYPPDEEVEAWVFGGGTAQALMTFQACTGLPETGCADEATWRGLIGDDEVDRRVAWEESGEEEEAAAGAAAAAAALPAAAAGGEAPSSSSSSSASSPNNGGAAATKKDAPWPILAEMDGGRAVRRLQIALGEAGFHCNEDEMQWWQFGQTTLESLRTYQACGGLPETGVTCARTWRALLGADARPEDLDASPVGGEGGGGGDAFADDLGKIASGGGRVWLLGEQRWSRPIESK